MPVNGWGAGHLSNGPHPRIAAIVAPAILLHCLVTELGCGVAPADGPAGACAEVVRIHGDLQGRVEVVGAPVELSEGSVRIGYRGMGAMNLPVEGSATCTFSVGDAGSLELLEASVDDSPLDAPEIDAIRAELGRSG